MPTIAVLNQKGGAGKTTLATNLSRALKLAGETVLLVDTDPQGSARDWSAAAGDNQSVPVVGLDRPQLLQRDLRTLAQPYAWTVIDGAPQLREMAAAAIAACDIVLIPVQPSPYDIWSAADLVDAIKARRALADGSPAAAFVVSRAIKNTRLGREVTEALADYELPVFEASTIQRQIYARSAIDGLSVLDSEPDGPAAAEIRAIVQELREVVERGQESEWRPRRGRQEEGEARHP